MDSNELSGKAARPWTQVVAAKRAIRDAHLRKHEPANRDPATSILGVGADIVNVKALTNLLRSGQVSAGELIRAYIGR